MSSQLATEYTANSGENNSGFINSDVVGENDKPSSRSISSSRQLSDIITRLVSENQDRSNRNAKIMAKYNAEQPYNNQKLLMDGLGWRSNFSTRPLANLVDRIAPRHVAAIDSVKYITNAHLSANFPEAAKKTEIYRREITQLCRKQRKWRRLISQISTENSLFGYTSACYVDDVAWLPKFFRQDAMLVPTGTSQLADEAQLIVLREQVLPHDLYSRIADREVAESVGWKVDDAIDALNKAAPITPSDMEQQGQARAWEDLNRGAALGYSYSSSGQTAVILYHVYVTEVTGKVSHYICAKNLDNKPIFCKHDRFENMSSVITFYTFQEGNSQLHGSLGVGRLLYNLTSAQDRARNEVLDRFQLSSKTVIRCDEKDIMKYKMSMVGSSVLISDNYTIEQSNIDAGIEEFIQLDAFLNQIADESVGNVSTNLPTMQGERVTAEAVKVVSSRQEEIRDLRLARFMDCFIDMVTMIQRRVADEEVAAEFPEVKAFRDACLAEMTEEEFLDISHCPAAETVEDLTTQQRQDTIQFLGSLKNAPFVDQEGLARTIGNLVSTPEIVKEVLPAANEKTEEPEQIRQQMMELTLLQSGAEVPISPRDNHLIHASIVLRSCDGLTNIEQLRNALKHAVEHAKASGDSDMLNAVRAKASELLTNAKSSETNEPDVTIQTNPGTVEGSNAGEAGGEAPGNIPIA